MFRKNKRIRESGFSLVELVVVIGIISILLAIAWFQFSAYTRKSQIEKQTRMLYGDLMEARSKAMFEKRVMTLQFTANGYTIAADGVVTSTKNLAYPINDRTVVYDTSGLTTNSGTICLTQSNAATVDSLVISRTRVQIGKKREGAACDEDHIDAK